MNKKIIAAALAGVFITPLAMADVTIYGFISAGVEGASATGAQNNAGTGKNEYVGRTRVSDENSRIGFKGTEDLGNGLKSVWQVENSLRSFTNAGTNDKGQSATFATRNTFVGLSDDTFGTFLMGYNDSAYKRFTDVGANVMKDTTADVEGGNGTSDIASRGDARLVNSIHYNSPIWNGFQGGASYGFDEAINSIAGPGTNQAQWDLAGSYTDSGLKLGLGYSRQQDTAANISASTLAADKGFGSLARVAGENTSFYKAAASYLFSTGTMLAASYEHASYGSPIAGGSNLDQNDYSLAATQDIGNATIKASYNVLGNLKNTTVGNAGDWGAKQWVLGATYNLSKQTQLLAYATQINNDSDQNVNFGVNPLYTTTAAASSTGSAVGLSAHNTLKALGVGMKVNF
jgi:predicted porin